MAEYIDREVAIDRLEKLFQLQKVTARAIMEAIPAADVRPVVLCRDCQYCHSDRAGNIGCFHYFHYQTNWGGKIKPDDYCSLGRKREET